MSLPRITIIIGVRNMAAALPTAIDSVLEQQYPNTELIVMDGLSTDGTVDVIKRYAQHIAYWESAKDRGHCDACNKALAHATGDFIAFLNGDDVIPANTFHQVAATYLAHPSVKIISGGAQIVEKTSAQQTRLLASYDQASQLALTLENILFGLPVINARYFHRDIFKLYGHFRATHADGTYNLSNDREFMIKLALDSDQLTQQFVPHIFYTYESSPESMTFSRKHTLKILREHIFLAQQFLALPGLTAQQTRLLKRWRAKESAYLFTHLLLQRQFREAGCVLKASVRQSFLLFTREGLRAAFLLPRKKLKI